MRRLSLSLLLVGGLVACAQASKPDDTSDDTADTEADADTDADADSDTDTDSDADTDASVVINELLLSNDTVNADEDGDYDDWLELYNPGGASVDLSGWTLIDSGDKTGTLPEGTVIDAQGHLLIWCDDDGEGLHMPFKLSAKGETVTLSDAGGAQVDQVEVPAQDTDVSYARTSDGASDWFSDDSPTPEAANN